MFGSEKVDDDRNEGNKKNISADLMTKMTKTRTRNENAEEGDLGSGSGEGAGSTPPSPTTTPYTTFTSAEKRLLTILLGFTTITSPLTATIYLPLLPLLRTHFHTSAQAINLTITIYIIFQALSPAIFGPLSDSLGRRPVYILTLSLYVAGNLGLALNRRRYYGVLLSLRALQSLGASAAFAVSYGVVADVCVPSERGRMLGPVGMALNLGACVGPIIGGWVAYREQSFEWVFWMLVIVGGMLLFAVGALLPETARCVVGNGSGRGEQTGWERPWCKVGWLWFDARRRRRSSSSSSSSSRSGRRKTREEMNESDHADGSRTEVREETHDPVNRFRVPNPLACLRIIFHKDTFLILWMHGSFYTVDYCLVAALPDIYATIYQYNELQVGLSYLPRGAGIIIGTFCNGKFMDHNYRVTAKTLGWTIDRVGGDDLSRFPIERARSRGSFYLLAISTATMAGYGWAVSRHVHVHVSVLFALQFIQGFWGTCFYTLYNTLLVDVFPQSPSTAAAAASITRCAMAAAGVAVLQPLLDAVGRGWYFSILGVWSGACGSVVVWLIRKKGMEWRTKREMLARGDSITTIA